MRGLYYTQKEKTEGLQMKGKKKYLTVSKEDVNKFIEYILIYESVVLNILFSLYAPIDDNNVK